MQSRAISLLLILGLVMPLGACEFGGEGEETEEPEEQEGGEED